KKCQELIGSGELSPGNLYSESAMSKQLGISRTPLRTALQQLEREGLIIRLPQRGFYVYQFEEKDIEELFAIRKAIEGYAVEHIARKKQVIDLGEAKKHLAAQEEARKSDDYSLFIREDRKFHENLVKALNNKRLVAIYSDMRQSIELLGLKRFKMNSQRNQSITENSQRNQSITEHNAIIKAIENGDPLAAREAVYNHLDMAMIPLKQYLKSVDRI
ncbi:MAG: GntR family transcriptional regulator, partial [Desulfobacterales bacterium]